MTETLFFDSRSKTEDHAIRWSRLRSLLLLVVFGATAFTVKTHAQSATDYQFSSSVGVYTPLGASATLVAAATDPDPGASPESAPMDDHVFTNNPLPFSFSFGGVSYSSYDICTNGWIGFGGTGSSDSYPLNSNVGNTSVIAPLGTDLLGISATSGVVTANSNVITNVVNTSFAKIGAPVRAGSYFPSGTVITGFTANTITVSNPATNGSATAQDIQWALAEIKTEVSGTAPNRIFTIEFSNFAEYFANSNTTNINFQILLNEAGGFSIVYGSSFRSTGSETAQVGFRFGGNVLTDFNNRTTTTDWFNTSAGTTNYATCTWSTAVAPADGLTFTWTPPTCLSPATNSINTTNITTSAADVSWSPSATNPLNGYDYYHSTSSTPIPDINTPPDGNVPATSTPVTLNNLTDNTTYFVWIRSNCGPTDWGNWKPDTFHTKCFITNDDCVGAIPLVQSSSCTPVSGTTCGATQSMAAAPCSGSPDDDVWYSFVATGTDARIDLTNVTAVSSVLSNSVNAYFQVLDPGPSGNCSSSMISLLCSDPNTGIVSGLSIGNTYYIRVYTFDSVRAAINFDICVSELPVPTTCATLGNPGNNNTLPVNYSPATLTWTAVANATAYDVYLDGNNPPSTLLATVTGNATTSYTFTTPLPVGDYYWHVVPKNSAGSPASCTNTRMFSIVDTPSNDDCSGAIQLVQGSTCVNIPGTTVGATQSMVATPCNGNPDDDVWYSFVATATDARITLSNVTAASSLSSSTDAYFQVLDPGPSGLCSFAMTSLLCSDPNDGLVGGLSIGNTYYIRVYTYGASPAAINFNICVSEITTAPTSCATLSNPMNNALVSAQPTLTWGSVTNATSYDVYLDGTNPPSTLIATVTNATSYTVNPALSPGDYYWYVVPKNANGGPTTCASSARKISVVTPPANDDCSGAIQLVQNSTCANTAGTTAGATQSMAAAPCNGNPDDDVWYYFVATTTDVTITLSGVTGVGSSSADAYFQVLDPGPSGICSGSMTSLVCSDPNSAVVGGLTVNQTYFIRVYTYPVAPAAINFDICVADYSAPAPAACATLNYPTDNAQVSAIPTLSWSTVTNASAYDIYLGAFNPPTTPFITVSGATTTSYQLTMPLPVGDFYWYVVPKNGSGAPIGCASNTRKMTVVAPPVNDDCSGAIALTHGSACSSVSGTTVSATQSMAAAPCNGNPDDDVWYSFVATATSAQVALTNVTAGGSSSSTDAYFQVLDPGPSGICSGSMTSLLCNDPNTGTVNGLAIGNTYYIRVYTYPVTPASINFDICISGGAVVTSINLGEFTAYNTGNANKLKWHSLSEERTDKYTLQRSSDGKSFVDLYEKTANGEPSHYTYVDYQPLDGANYYRLMMKDISGRIQYSQTEKVIVNAKTGMDITASPNPVVQDMTVTVSGLQVTDATIYITDLNGKVIYNLSMTDNQLKVDLSTLNRGVYFVKYVDATNAKTIKIIKD